MGKHILMKNRNFQPIVILITGPSNVGKTSTAGALKNHHNQVMHGDALLYTLNQWSSDSQLHHIHKNFLHRYQNELDHHLGELGFCLDTSCATRFVAQFVEYLHSKIEKPVVILEGHVFGLPNIKHQLMSQLRHHYHYYLWEMNRLGGT